MYQSHQSWLSSSPLSRSATGDNSSTPQAPLTHLALLQRKSGRADSHHTTPLRTTTTTLATIPPFPIFLISPMERTRGMNSESGMIHSHRLMKRMESHRGMLVMGRLGITKGRVNTMIHLRMVDPAWTYEKRGMWRAGLDLEAIEEWDCSRLFDHGRLFFLAMLIHLFTFMYPISWLLAYTWTPNSNVCI